MSVVDFGIKRLDVTLRGMPGSPLVIHAFPDKAKQEIRDKQQKKAKVAKASRDPNQEFLESRYVDVQGRECAPLAAIKKATVNAASAFDDMTKVNLRMAFFVRFADEPAASLIPIEKWDGTPAVGVMREDAVTIGMNTRGLVYRPEYPEWQLRVKIEYQPRLVSQDQLLALLAHAGWGIGICEGRPQKTGDLGWGRFEIAMWSEDGK